MNLALLEYIDGFYNSRRIQKRIGYLSPIEFEENHYADEATTEPVPSRRADVCAGHERMRATRRTNPRHQPLRGCAATSRAVRGASAYRGPRSERELEGSVGAPGPACAGGWSGRRPRSWSWRCGFSWP
ncbi:IS3 family transposase [Streptomyces sp. NPDC087437]|uniref:IS3 family transposase n=1 Tax=Streptomyces sp. NPDC087437 TaxID=3365789 RepID=UPI003825C889